MNGGKAAVEEDEDDAAEDPVPVGEIHTPSDIPKPPSKPNPIILALYGQFCITAKSYQSAICRLLFISIRS